MLRMTDDDMVELKRNGIIGVRLESLFVCQRYFFEQPGIEDFLKRCARNDIIAEVFATPATWPKVIDKLRRVPLAWCSNIADGPRSRTAFNRKAFSCCWPPPGERIVRSSCLAHFA